VTDREVSLRDEVDFGLLRELVQLKLSLDVSRAIGAIGLRCSLPLRHDQTNDHRCN
jgi:hypothetical protein